MSRAICLTNLSSKFPNSIPNPNEVRPENILNRSVGPIYTYAAETEKGVFRNHSEWAVS